MAITPDVEANVQHKLDAGVSGRDVRPLSSSPRYDSTRTQTHTNDFDKTVIHSRLFRSSHTGLGDKDILWGQAKSGLKERAPLPVVPDSTLFLGTATVGLLDLFKRNKKAAASALSLSLLFLHACSTPAPATAVIETPIPFTPTLTEAPTVVVTPSPLVNIEGTGVPPITETLVPVDGSYPTSVMTLDSARVYNYSGVEGRGNLPDNARAQLDRYVAELVREGFIKPNGNSLEAVYAALDKKYEYNLYQTDTMSVWLLQGISDKTLFLVPETEDGQIFRDLQLGQDFLYQDAGEDNFNFREFHADAIGGHARWPIMANVNESNIPQEWLDMDHEGRETAIALASATDVPAPTEQANQPKEGQVTVVNENGHTYKYTWTKVGETPDGEPIFQNVREVADFPLMDYPYWNFLPFKIYITDSALGERFVYEMTHVDDLPDGVGSYPDGRTEPMPIKTNLITDLTKSYFLNDPRPISENDKPTVLRKEMQGEGRQAYLKVFDSQGDEVSVKLSPDTGIILTIMDKETLLTLGGDNVSTWEVGTHTVYSEVYGVDEKGNMLCRFAVDGSIADFTDEELRLALFTFPANFVLGKDQGNQGQSDLSVTLAHVSAWDQPLGGTTKDLEIELVPQK